MNLVKYKLHKVVQRQDMITNCQLNNTFKQHKVRSLTVRTSLMHNSQTTTSRPTMSISSQSIVQGLKTPHASLVGQKRMSTMPYLWIELGRTYLTRKMKDQPPKDTQTHYINGKGTYPQGIGLKPQVILHRQYVCQTMLRYMIRTMSEL